MIHCNFYIYIYIYVGRTQWWIPPKPSEWKKLCKDNVKPCQHCVPSPTLKIIVPPDSSGSTVPQIAGYDLEQSHSPTNRNGLQQLFSNEQNQGFPRTQKWHKLRCALLGLDRPVMEFGREASVGRRTADGRPRSPGRDTFLALSHSLREKLSLLLVVSAAWLPSRRLWGGKKLFVLLGSKKLGHWVGVLSHHPWCWISKYVLEHPQSCDLTRAVRSVNDLTLETVPK